MTGRQALTSLQQDGSATQLSKKNLRRLDGRMPAAPLPGGCHTTSLHSEDGAAKEKATAPAIGEIKSSNTPDEVLHLLSIVDALEAVISLKRGGRAKHVLFRADKTAVEQAARRDFKVKHLQQLKTLLGDAMELRWVTPHTSQRKGQGTACVRDLDLAVRFHVQRTSAPSEANTPPRGRSVTRCQITASSGSPPRLAPVLLSPQSSPSKASLTAGCNSEIRKILLNRMSKHIAASQSQLPQDISCLDDIFSHPSWTCSSWESVKPADLPERPQMTVRVSGSLSATPQRCGSASHSLLTPSPSIRYRNFSVAGLQSAQATPQSVRGVSPSLTHTSPSPFCAPTTTPHHDQHEGQHQAARLTDEPVQLTDGVTRRVLFPEPETPHKSKAVPLRADSACKPPRHTPGKRKRDVSPMSPVAERSPSQASTAYLKTPVAIPFATPQKRSASKAHRTPGRTCVGLTPNASATPVQASVKGAQASPAVRRQLMSMSTPSMYSDRLPLVHVRTPEATPKAKSRTSVPTTPINDVNGRHAHCSVATPGSAQSVKPSPAVNFSRAIQVCASPGPAKVANAETFYSSPSKPQTATSVKGSLPFKVVNPVAKVPSPAKSRGSLTYRTKAAGNKPTSDAACLAASIMDNDMAELLASNSKKASEYKIAQHPKNVRKAMDKEAKRALPAIYDVIRAAFQKHQSLGVPYEACVTAIHDAGLHNRSMSSDAAAVFLDCLVTAVPEWITVRKVADGETVSKVVSISRMCTGIRQKLEQMAFSVE